MNKTLLLAMLLLAMFLPAPPLLRGQSITAVEANSHVGETTTVCGKVSGIHTAAGSKGKPTFINFDKPYPSQDFTVMIWDDDRVRRPGEVRRPPGMRLRDHYRISR